MRTIILCITLFFFGSPESKSQVPGYLGKRAAVKLHTSFMGAYYGPTPSNRGKRYYGDEGGGIGINAKYGLDFSYVVSRRYELFLGYERAKVGLKSAAKTPLFPGANNSTDFVSHNLFYHININNLRFGYRRYRHKKGGLAPFGPYGGFIVNAGFINGTIEDKQSLFNGEIITDHPDLGVDPKLIHWSVLFEFGYSNIFRDRFLFNISFQLDPTFGYISRTQYSISGDTSLFTNYEGNNQENFKGNVAERMVGFNAAMFNVGLGMLLF